MANRTISINVNGQNMKAIVNRTNTPIQRKFGLLLKPMDVRKEIEIAVFPVDSDEAVEVGLRFASVSRAVRHVRDALAA